MSDIREARKALVTRILEGGGEASGSQRRAAFDNETAEPVRTLIQKVALYAHKVTDDDVAACLLYTSCPNMACRSRWRPCERICGGCEKKPQARRRGPRRNVCETPAQSSLSRSHSSRSRRRRRRSARRRRHGNRHNQAAPPCRPSQRNARRCRGPGVSRSRVDPRSR